jgi:hypothetical protein
LRNVAEDFLSTLGDGKIKKRKLVVAPPPTPTVNTSSTDETKASTTTTTTDDTTTNVVTSITTGSSSTSATTAVVSKAPTLLSERIDSTRPLHSAAAAASLDDDPLISNVPVDSQSGQWRTENRDGVLKEVSYANIDSASITKGNEVLLYWIDATELKHQKPGSVFLFGKVSKKKKSKEKRKETNKKKNDSSLSLSLSLSLFLPPRFLLIMAKDL